MVYRKSMVLSQWIHELAHGILEEPLHFMKIGVICHFPDPSYWLYFLLLHCEHRSVPQLSVQI